MLEFVWVVAEDAVVVSLEETMGNVMIITKLFVKSLTLQSR